MRALRERVRRWAARRRPAAPARAPLVLERLEERILLDATPAANVNVPAEGLINEGLTFGVTFDNVGADVGFGPFVDVVTPKGIAVSGATVDGGAASRQVVGYWDAADLRWEAAPDGSGAAVTDNPSLPGADPAAPGAGQPANPGGRTGDVWQQVRLPYGSFAPAQPAITITFTATLDGRIADGAVVNEPLTIRAIGGFRFGDQTPVNDPPPLGTDPPVYGAAFTGTVTPTVVLLSKSAAVQEGGTVTGPNFPFTYTLAVDIANLETVTALQLRDALPNNVAYLGGSLAFTAGGTVVSLPAAGVPANGSLLGIDYPSFTGAPGVDILVTYQAFFPDNDANGAPVLDPGTGTGTATNTVSLAAQYLDGNGVLQALADTEAETVQARALQVLKGFSVVGGGPVRPGATIAFTLDFAASDYATLAGVELVDELSDGLVFDAGFVPAYSLTQDGATRADLFDAPNFSLVANPSGTTTLTLRLSDQLVTDGAASGDVQGDLVNPPQEGPTVGRITFRALVVQTYTVAPPGDANVDMGDPLSNDVALNATLQPPVGAGTPVSNPSGVDFSVTALGGAAKSIYAITDSTGTVTIDPAPAQRIVAPGDLVTYRLQVQLGTGDASGFLLRDFLPLPVFSAASIAKPPGLSNAPTAAPPAAGEIAFGPAHTLPAAGLLRPGGAPFDPAADLAVTTDAASNAVTFDFGGFSEPAGSNPYTIDLLFTVRAADRPFADGLLLTNVGQAQLTNSQLQVITQTSTAQITLRQPELALAKGIVGASNPGAVLDPLAPGPAAFAPPGSAGAPFAGSITSAALAATPIDSNVTGVDGADLLRFAIVLENSGGDDGFDLLVRDTPATGFALPGAGTNLQVTRGDGTALAFTGDLFGAGLSITDPLTEGAIRGEAGRATGANVVVITYDLALAANVTATTAYENDAELLFYAAGEGGNNFVFAGGPFTDEAEAKVADPAGAKTLAGTDRPFTADPDVTIGEIATYRLVVTLPEGVTDGLLVADDIPAGMRYVAGSLAVDASGFAGAVGAPTVTGGGGSGADVTFDFGTVTHAAPGPGTAQNTIVLTYRAEVLDVPGNVGFGASPTQLVNTASIDYATNLDDLGAPRAPLPAGAVTLRVVEPFLAVDKVQNRATADAGDTIEVTITVTNTGLSPAFNPVILDEVGRRGQQAKFDDLVALAAPPGYAATVEGADRLVTWRAVNDDPVDVGEALTFRMSYRLTDAVVTNERLVNTGSADRYFTLPGADGRQGGPVSDDVFLRVPNAQFAKQLVGTSIVDAGNTNTEAVIGERVTYRLVVTMPEGTTPNARIVDSLDAGLAFVGLTSIVPSSAFISSSVGDFSSPAAFVSLVQNQGGRVTFDLGTLVVPGITAGLATQSLTLTYDAVVLNTAGNQAGLQLNNSARLTADANVGITRGAPNVTVIEPQVALIKDVDVLGKPGGAAEAGDTVRYTLTFANAAGEPTAYDLALADVLPVQLADVQVIGVTDSAGLLDAADVEIGGGTVVPGVGTFGGTVRFAVQPDGTRTIDLAGGRTVTVILEGAVNLLVTPSSIVTNTARIDWSSLDGDVPGPLSPFVGNGTARERTGADPAGVDGYVAEDAASFTVGAIFNVKDIVSTSEASTGEAGGLERVVIGEVVRFRLVSALPQAITPDLVLVDRLPDGLQFLDDGTARVGFVGDGGGLLSFNPSRAAALGQDWSITDPAAFFVGSEATIDGIVPVFALDDDNVSAALGPNIDVYGPGTDVYFRLGTVANTDLDANLEFVVVEFNAVVSNVLTNQRERTVLENRYESWDALLVPPGNDPTPSGEPSNAVRVGVVEPRVEISKDVATVPADGGDTVVYELVIANATTGALSSTAFDSRVVDDLDAQLGPGTVTITAIAIDTAGAPGSVVTDATAGNRLDIDIDRLRPGEFVVVSVTGRVADNVPAGLVLANTATLTTTSLPGLQGTLANPTGSATPGAPGTASGERTGADGPGPGDVVLNNYSTSASASTTLDAPFADKLAPAKDEYVIGELVVFPIVVTLPEGVSADVVVRDLLPDGLAYLEHRFVVVPTGDLVTEPYAGVLPPDGVIGVGGSGVTASAGVSGADLVIAMGDLVNPADNNPNNNRFLLAVTAVVVNEIANQAGRTLLNVGDLTYTDPALGVTLVPDPDGGPTITLDEPVLGLLKSAVSVPTSGLDGGDVVTYAVDLRNSVFDRSTADAYDAIFTDVLPASMSITAFRVVPSGVFPLPLFFIDSVGGGVDNRIRATAFDLALGNGFTLEYDAVIRDTVAPGAQLDNAAELVWRSLPESPLGGQPLGERDGSGGGTLGDGSLNDYRLASTARVDVATIDTLDKQVVATSLPGTGSGEWVPTNPDLAVGEEATFRVTLTLPEVTVGSLVLTDTLPLDGGVSRLLIDGARTVFRADLSDANLSAAPTVTLTPTTFTVAFGALTNAVDATVTARTNKVVFDVVGTLRDIPQNVNGDLVTNAVDATFTSTAQSGTLNAAASLDVVEPELVIDKRADATSADIGDVLTYTITVNHTAASTSPAFAVVIADDLLNGAGAAPDDDLALVAGSVTASAGTVVIGSAPGDTDIRVEIAQYDPSAAPIVITFQAQLKTSLIAVGDAMLNTASVDWTSSLVPGPGRPGDDTDDHLVTLPVGSATPEFAKIVLGTSFAWTGSDEYDPAFRDVTPGETVTYRVGTLLRLGSYPTAGDIVIADVLPAGMTLVGTPVVSVGTAITLASAPVVTPGPGGFSVTLDLDQVNVGSGLLAERIVAITYDALVGDVPAVANGNPLVNAATLDFTPTAVTLNAATTLDVVEPLLVIDKQASTTLPVLGEAVTYTVTVQHDLTSATGSTADAFDLLLEDLLPPAWVTLIPGTVTVSGAPAAILSGNGVGDTAVTVSLAALELDRVTPDVLTITYQGRVTGDPAGYGQTATNTADLDYDNVPGTPAVQRSYAASDSLTVTIVGPDLVIAKTDGLAAAAPGDTLTYTVTVDNVATVGLPANTARDLVITDTLPVGVTFVSASGGGTYDANARTVTWQVASLASGSSLTRTFEVRIDDPAAAGIESVLNTVSVAHAAIEPTPGNNTATDVTAVIAAPALEIFKDNFRVDVVPGEAITYFVLVRNTGNQDASNVVVTDDYPALLGGVTASAGGVVDAVGTTVTWALGTLRGGEFRLLSLSGTLAPTVPAGVTQVVNDVDVTDDGAGTGGIPLTDSAQDVDNLLAAPDYVITKTDGRTEVLPTERVTYTLTIANAGNQDGTGVIVADDYPEAFLLNVTASDGGVVNAAAGTVEWTIGPLAAGQTIVRTLTGEVPRLPDPREAVLLNVATVTDDAANGPDPTPGNNIATDTTRLVPAAPDYVIAKTDNRDVVRPGETVTYVIDVRNAGTLFGTGIVVTDAYQRDTLDAVTAGAGGVVDAAAGTVTWSLDRLDPGEARTLTFTGRVVQVVPPGTDVLANRVVVADDGLSGPDPQPGNNAAQDLTDIQVYVYDALDTVRGEGWTWRDPLPFLQSPPTPPLYTGQAAPLTAVTVVVYGANGAPAGYQTVLADASGQWMANLANAVLADAPYGVTLLQSPAHVAFGAPEAVQLRVFYTPDAIQPAFMTFALSPEAILARSTDAGNEALAAAVARPLDSPYFAPASAAPAPRSL